MKKRSISVACLLLTACVARGQDAAAPATAPAEDNIPVADMSSQFDYRKMADALIAKYDKDPIGRIAKPEEVAGFFTYLASDWASFFTGAVLMMDGGYSAR